MPQPFLTPELIEQLQSLKSDLERLTSALQNTEGMSPHEIEGRMRQFQDKEREIKAFLVANNIMPTGDTAH